MPIRPVVHAVLAFGSIGFLAMACSSTPSVEDYCGKLKARYDACPNGSGGPSADPAPVGDGGTAPTPTRPAFNQANCERDHRCITALFDNAVTRGYLDCASNTDCSVSTSKCDDDAISAGPNATEADTCAKKYAECKNGKDGDFDDDICTAVKALNSDTLSKVMPCLDKPCREIEDCVEATTEAISAGCGID